MSAGTVGAGGAGAAAAATARAIKASGVIVHVEPDDFVGILKRQAGALVVHATGGFFSTNYQYLTSYKGLAFFTKTPVPLDLLPGIEVVQAGASRSTLNGPRRLTHRRKEDILYRPQLSPGADLTLTGRILARSSQSVSRDLTVVRREAFVQAACFSSTIGNCFRPSWNRTVMEIGRVRSSSDLRRGRRRS